jgi:hypothetical protein
MKITYTFKTLSPDEQEFLEQVLLAEMNLQTWFAVSYNELLQEELFLVVH